MEEGLCIPHISPQTASYDVRIESILHRKGCFLLYLIQLFDFRDNDTIGGISVSILLELVEAVYI